MYLQECFQRALRPTTCCSPMGWGLRRNKSQIVSWTTTFLSLLPYCEDSIFLHSHLQRLLPWLPWYNGLHLQAVANTYPSFHKLICTTFCYSKRNSNTESLFVFQIYLALFNAAHASLEFAIFLPLPLECWNYICKPPGPDTVFSNLKKKGQETIENLIHSQF